MSKRQVVCLGAGVIGAGWAARCLENGHDVRVYDIADNAEENLNAVLQNAEHAYAKLTMAQRPRKGQLQFCANLESALQGAEWVIESVPERLDIKRALYREIEQNVPANTMIVSSTSGIMPSDLQAEMRQPDRLLVAHPFNPVYLLPLVELVAGRETATSAVDEAREFYSAMGMKPIVVKKEIEAFVADRLLEAIWRESL
ncbi:MAG: 3-hydroxyacyl-CoA dehydrogenase NAD-binding domain-containing protein, partial [Granulosicoccus sp.]